MRHLLRLMAAGATCAFACSWMGRAAGEGPDLPVVYQADFEKGAEDWEPTDSEAWKIEPGNGGQVYSLFGESEYTPPHRSPLNMALLKNVNVADFVLQARLKSTIADYGHRDMCLFFGYQDQAHFYYVHLAKETDDRANQVFIVNGADRQKISTKTSSGTPWDDAWHEVKIVRNTADGTIEVYFDDMQVPTMTANDATFVTGRVGLGSFDDTGEFDDVVLHAAVAEASDEAANTGAEPQ